MKRILIALLLTSATLSASEFEAVKSFEDIPPLAKTTAEARQRYSPRVLQADGRSGPGDKLAEAIDSRVAAQTRAAMLGAAAMPGHPGAMSRSTGQTIGMLQREFQRLNMEQRDLTIAAGTAQKELERELNEKLSAINKKHLSHAQNVAETNAACDAYLREYAPKYEDMKLKAKHIAGECQSVLDEANKSFGGQPPAMAGGMIRGIAMLEATCLVQALSAESQTVELIYLKSYPAIR